jgi:8-oxo-dGTP pyrophosphatase MutT (NUDIX family)
MRIDYYDDPDAPQANSIVVAATAFVQDDAGRILMINKTDNGTWALPGGAQEIGETLTEAAERETLEETGYVVRVTGIIGIYSDPRHVIAYDDGEVRQEFSISLRASMVSGSARTSSESSDVRWVDPDGLEHLELPPWTRTRIARALDAGPPFVA